MSLIESALAPVLRGLGERCATESGFSPTVGLIRSILHGRRDTLSLAFAEVNPGSARTRTRDAPVLAAFGYHASIDGAGKYLTAEEWSQAREHLAGRDPFPEDRASFFFRPWHLYGVASGVDAHRAYDEGGVLWLRGLLHDGLAHTSQASLEYRIAFNMAAQRCGATVSLPVVEQVESVSTADLAMLLWAREQLGHELCVLRGEAPEAVLFDRLIRDGVRARDAVEAAFTLAALDELVRQLRALLARGTGGVSAPQVTVSGQNVQILTGGTGYQSN